MNRVRETCRVEHEEEVGWLRKKLDNIEAHKNKLML